MRAELWPWEKDLSYISFKLGVLWLCINYVKYLSLFMFFPGSVSSQHNLPDLLITNHKELTSLILLHGLWSVPPRTHELPHQWVLVTMKSNSFFCDNKEGFAYMKPHSCGWHVVLPMSDGKDHFSEWYLVVM